MKILLTSALLLTGALCFAQAPAFPGAEGYGRYVAGGRGGQVVHVTNLNDSGDGSLRHALSMPGRRIVVFDVAGTIFLESKLSISSGDVTVLGQTAPGDGVTVANFSTECNSSNVVVRFLRFRLGDKGNAADGSNDQDTFWGRNRRNLMLDHCSMSWSTDECSSWYDNESFTMQWCILAESLKGSNHWKGNHGYGGIWGGHGATFHHNMLAHHDSRNPRFCGSRFCNDQEHEHVDYRNCVVYNWGQTNSGYAAEGGTYNFTNNYYKPGPGTASSLRHRIFQPGADDGSNAQPKGVYGHFYVHGNYMDGQGKYSQNFDWRGIDIDARNNSAMTIDKIKSDTEYDYAPVTTHTAEQAFAKVLDYAGQSYRRDAVDDRVTEEARNGEYTYTGSHLGGKGIIDSQEDVGGWPQLDPGTPQTDSDGDGIPDAWETANGLDPADPADAATYSLDPARWYTNIEIYANSLVQDLVKASLADADITVKEYWPRYVRADGSVSEAENTPEAVPDTPQPELTAVAEGSLTWPLADATFGEAEVDAALAPYIEATSSACGSNFEIVGTRKLNNLLHTELRSLATEHDPAAANALTFSLTAAEGYRFAPKTLSFRASRIGTDSGVYSLSWLAGDSETCLEESGSIARNKAEFGWYSSVAHEVDLSLLPAAARQGAAQCAMRVNLYDVNGGKSTAIGGVTISGAIVADASAISSVSAESSAPDTYYNIAGQRVKPGKSGIYVRKRQGKTEKLVRN